MTQFPSDGYIEPDGNVTPIDPLKDLYSQPQSGGEMVPVDNKQSAASEPVDDDDLRKRAKKIVRQRQELRQSTIWFGLIITMLWVIWLGNLLGGDGTGFPWPLFPMFFWGMSLVNRRQRLQGKQETEVEAEMKRLRGEQ